MRWCTSAAGDFVDMCVTAGGIAFLMCTLCIGCSWGEFGVVNFVFCEGLQSFDVQNCWRRLMRTIVHSPFLYLDTVPLLLCLNENLRTNVFQIKTQKVWIYIKSLLTKYREIFPPLVIVRTRGHSQVLALAHNDREREYFAILCQ